MNHPKCVSKLTVILAILVAGSEVSAQELVNPSVDVGTDFNVSIHLDSFDTVWETVRKAHWDKETVGESWDTARDTFRPRVETATSARDVRRAINEMLGTLGQSHFGIIASDEYDSMEGEQVDGGEGTAGLEIRLVEDQLVVTRVFPGLPGEAAGIQPGWIVKLIDSRTADEIIDGAETLSKHSAMRVETAVGLICDGRTSGEIGSKLAFAFVDHQKETRLEYLRLVKGAGQVEKFGNLPLFVVDFQSRELDAGIGYVSFNAFIGGPRLIREYNQAIRDYRDKKGLIIDLRGNRGGIVMLVSGMCGWLVDKKDPLGTMTFSGGTEIHLALNPRKPMFQKPVAILTDECSISAAEIMAGGIKDLKIGRVFGSTTAGLSLPSTVVKLPNGDGFQYALANYTSASGETIEGVGVLPDVEIKLTREMLSNSGDPVLSAAKKWILEQEE